MVDYVNREIVKDGFDGLDAKDVSLTSLPSFIACMCWVMKHSFSQLVARFTISIVSKSIYNVDPKCFDGEESEILKMSQKFTTPTKRFMITAMLTTMYPFLSKYLKLSLTLPGAENFFIDLMQKAIDYREQNKIQNADYLDHLMTLKNKKQVTGNLHTEHNRFLEHSVNWLIDFL